MKATILSRRGLLRSLPAMFGGGLLAKAGLAVGSDAIQAEAGSLLPKNPPGGGGAKTFPVEVPFTLGRGGIHVRLTVQGETTAALVDTGAVRTVLDSPYVETRGIKAPPIFGKDGAPLPGRGAKQPAVALKGVDIRLNGFDVTSSPYASNLAPLSEHAQVSAVVGMDLFEAAVVEFDFDRMLMTLHDPAGFTPPPRLNSTPLREDRHRLYVSLAINGQAPEPAVLDTGAAPALLINSDRATALGLTPSDEPGHTFVGANTAGTSALTKVDKVQLGQLVFGHVTAQIPPQQNAVFGGAPLILGLGLLTHLHLIVDLPGGRILAAPRAHA